MKNGINHHIFNTLNFEVLNILLERERERERRRRYTLIINLLSKEEKTSFPRLQNINLSLSKAKNMTLDRDFFVQMDCDNSKKSLIM